MAAPAANDPGGKLVPSGSIRGVRGSKIGKSYDNYMLQLNRGIERFQESIDIHRQRIEQELEKQRDMLTSYLDRTSEQLFVEGEEMNMDLQGQRVGSTPATDQPPKPTIGKPEAYQALYFPSGINGPVIVIDSIKALSYVKSIKRPTGNVDWYFEMEIENMGEKSLVFENAELAVAAWGQLVKKMENFYRGKVRG
jgi:hypothetical protein